METSEFKCGHVALIGKPNVGKSTLMNVIVGQKVSIVSNKPQTTRRKIIGIANRPNSQIIFVDTPGIHTPHTRLDKAMVDSARSALNGVDLIVVVTDVGHHPGELDQEVALGITRFTSDTPVLLCLNKMDRLKPEYVQPFVDAYSNMFHSEDYMMTRADRGTNVEKLVELIISKLPIAAAEYPEDEFTDQSSTYMAAELVREKILQTTRQEIPYATAVTIDTWEDEPNLLRIGATILVEKASQRGILIGKQGQFLKAIGTDARKEIEVLIGRKIYLDLHIRVEEGWRMNPRILHELEYSDISS